jgi:hypothetical protein
MWNKKQGRNSPAIGLPGESLPRSNGILSTNVRKRIGYCGHYRNDFSGNTTQKADQSSGNDSKEQRVLNKALTFLLSHQALQLDVEQLNP